MIPDSYCIPNFRKLSHFDYLKCSIDTENIFGYQKSVGLKFFSMFCKILSTDKIDEIPNDNFSSFRMFFRTHQLYTGYFLFTLILNASKTFVCNSSQFRHSSALFGHIFLNLNKRIYLGISVTYDRNTRLVTCANNSQHKVHFNFSRIQPRYSTKPRSPQIFSDHLRSNEVK